MKDIKITSISPLPLYVIKYMGKAFQKKAKFKEKILDSNDLPFVEQIAKRQSSLIAKEELCNAQETSSLRQQIDLIEQQITTLKNITADCSINALRLSSETASLEKVLSEAKASVNARENITQKRIAQIKAYAEEVHTAYMSGYRESEAMKNGK